ncbi:VOC family protein [Planktothrix sp. FACHB-1355]|uniref:VOC family protein n=1 Tax=Aerosakkonema funiforme FACHB-1375 TaxID=2949571 RepID=A0A926VLI7_9CYAN|nr:MULTISPECIES: VOC family protein [Oscillatoriales]MBD2186152.1 VOC family protein [Aerosakkonema funiforme FACHB-1375]MBD3560514.1 VOC family protein [Planktothrix sp. FACHB-1355]
MNEVLFHLAFPVTDITQTKAFYADGLGCEIGRETPNSVILNLYGHQIVAHVAKEAVTPQKGIYPRHFGLVFTSEADWEALLERAKQKNLSFYQEAKRRFAGLPTEHRTFFLEDPFHNLLEFKYYCHASAIFGDREYAQVGDTV